MSNTQSSKNSFVLYCDIYNSIKEFSIDDKATLLDAIFCYSIGEDIPKMSNIVKVAFSFIKTTLDRDKAKWEQTRTERQIAGSKGGKQRVANQANASFAKQIKQKQANQAVSVSVNDSVITNKSKTNLERMKNSFSILEDLG